MKFILDITQDCINNGKRNDGENCPIAIALRNAGFINPQVFNNHPVVKNREIDFPYITFEDKEDNEYKLRNEMLETWVENFDRGMEVKPFKVELDID